MPLLVACATRPTLMSSSPVTPQTGRPWWLKLLLALLGLGVAAALVVALLVGVVMAVAYPQLPNVTELADYRPKLPLRIYSAEGQLRRSSPNSPSN